MYTYMHTYTYIYIYIHTHTLQIIERPFEIIRDVVAVKEVPVEVEKFYERIVHVDVPTDKVCMCICIYVCMYVYMYVCM